MFRVAKIIRRVYEAIVRRRLVFFGLALLSGISLARAQLTASDVQQVINQAVKRANKLAPNSVIAVTDREGYVLGVWVPRGGEPTDLEVAVSVGKAGTAAFLSSNANAFTSRTAGFIIQQHFPPGVKNLPPGPLVGVGFSNLPFSDVNRFKKPDFIPSSASPGTRGSPIPLTSLNGIPGGVPLYKNGVLVGGVGVTGSGIEFPPTTFIDGYTKDEDVALAGQKGFAPSSAILATNVFIGGISPPYVQSSAGSSSGASVTGNAALQYPVIGSPPPFPYSTATFSGVSGQVRQPIISDPISTPINGQPRLTSAEVASVIAAAADRVRTTRAGIRLPIGSRMEAFITVVNNPNLPFVGPTVLGAFRTGEATIFSWDVAVQKARTAVGFSDNTRAFSTRTVGFLAQTHFPPGIDPDGPGPIYGMQEEVSGFVRAALPTLVPTASLIGPIFTPPNPQFPNGMTIFPGGFPLYRNGVLIGAVGISGDGVDQDDIVGASGSSVFLPPIAIEADRFEFKDTRLPYAKFPRDPNGISDPPPPIILPIFAPPALTAELANISVRLRVDIGERLMIGGFIITGDVSKRVIVRGLGPSLAAAGIVSPLADPAMELHDSLGRSFAQNLNWKDTQQNELLVSGLAPSNDAEAAMMQTLPPGVYTATMTGQSGGTGVALLEVYEGDQSLGSRIANLSARGFVGNGDEVMIGGFIVRGNGISANLLVRALGPSLASAGIAQPLSDPAIEIHDGNGAIVAKNDNWRDTQAVEIQGRSLTPPNELESAAIISAGPGVYTAILKGNGGGTGVALLEIYRLQ